MGCEERVICVPPSEGPGRGTARRSIYEKQSSVLSSQDLSFLPPCGLTPTTMGPEFLLSLEINPTLRSVQAPISSSIEKSTSDKLGI